jgi:hypothetical protein
MTKNIEATSGIPDHTNLVPEIGALNQWHRWNLVDVGRPESARIGGPPSSTVGRVLAEFLTTKCYLNGLRNERRRPFPL